MFVSTSVRKTNVRKWGNGCINISKNTLVNLNTPPLPRIAYVTDVTDGLHCCSRTSSILKKLFPSTEKKSQKFNWK